MVSFPHPLIFCSRCITFEKCRWNGAMISSDVVEEFKSHMDFITHCPEKEIGLGVPRPSVRLVKVSDQERLIQSETSQDVTELMDRYSDELLLNLQTVDGFILKGKSPTCGLAQVNLYSDPIDNKFVGYSKGRFAQKILTFISTSRNASVITDEGRLINPRLREDFLTRIYTLARFRALGSQPNVKELIAFHTQHKLILMAYSQEELKTLGQIVAKSTSLSPEIRTNTYRTHLYHVLASPVSEKRHINVLMHAFGYFKHDLIPSEKQFFLNQVEAYRKTQVPLSVPISILQTWILRFNQPYLADQLYFTPFPPPLQAKLMK